MVIPLSNTEPGDQVRILMLANDAPMAARLSDLGFAPGSFVSCVLKKKNGHIAAYLVRNTLIALRQEDSRLIMVGEQAAGHAVCPEVSL